MDVWKELPGFIGSREQIVLSAYLEALSVEQRDRVIGAPELKWCGWQASGENDGPCLVQAAEHGLERPTVYELQSVSWTHPIAQAMQVDLGFGCPPTRAFDWSMPKYGSPFIRWLKETCARLNGSSAEQVAVLSAADTTVMVGA